MKKITIKILFLIASAIIAIWQPQQMLGQPYEYMLWVQFIIILGVLGISLMVDFKTYKEETTKRNRMLKAIQNGTLEFKADEREVYNKFKKELDEILKKHNMTNVVLDCYAEKAVKKILLYEDIKVTVDYKVGNKFRCLNFIVKNTKNGPVVIDKDVFTNPEKYREIVHLKPKQPYVRSSYNYVPAPGHFDSEDDDNGKRRELAEYARTSKSTCWHVDDEVREELEEQRRQEEERNRKIDRENQEREEEEYYARLKEEDDAWWDENVYHR